MTTHPPAAKPITSLANPIVKDIRGLALAKNRKESGLFLAEGLKLVADAVESGWRIRTLVHAGAVEGLRRETNRPKDDVLALLGN